MLLPSGSSTKAAYNSRDDRRAARVEYEGGVIAGMVGARPRLAVVGAARGDGGLMEVAHRLLAVGAECDMRGNRSLPGLLHRRNVEIGSRSAIVDAESDGRLVVGLGNVAERRQGLGVERDAPLRVRSMKSDVVKHDFHSSPDTRVGRNLTIPAYSPLHRLPSWHTNLRGTAAHFTHDLPS